ncbi:Uncharacterized protein TCM_038399 [Theobroma cacao]|uniref:Uncharacterized protein n=1 Tax=Theobroma cacao TaxID=3641 RepID=A0A061GPL0_THECC|nr:Uncharacterized protein TCM_038399 [Theobroma cacao]
MTVPILWNFFMQRFIPAYVQARPIMGMTPLDPISIPNLDDPREQEKVKSCSSKTHQKEMIESAIKQWKLARNEAMNLKKEWASKKKDGETQVISLEQSQYELHNPYHPYPSYPYYPTVNNTSQGLYPYPLMSNDLHNPFPYSLVSQTPYFAST